MDIMVITDRGGLGHGDRITDITDMAGVGHGTAVGIDRGTGGTARRVRCAARTTYCSSVT